MIMPKVSVVSRWAALRRRDAYNLRKVFLLAGGAPRVALWWSKLWTIAPLL